jgi:hypothetical protein
MKLVRAATILVVFLAHGPGVRAQAKTGSIITFEVENATFYGFDCPFSQLGSNPSNLERSYAGTTLGTGLGVGDIVSVNGSLAKGAIYESAIGIHSNSPGPGTFLTDKGRFALEEWSLDFLDSDGNEIGTIYFGGLANGGAPPDAPKALVGTGNGALSVKGGTGAFLGVQGYMKIPSDPTAGERFTSACEDPSLRRTYAAGRGKRHGTMYLIPLTQPQVIATPGGPAIVHSVDNTLVTAAKPAQAGEILTLFASGLGATRPGVDPGQPFPSSPLQVVNSPVQVLVNGNPGDILYAGGYPGAVDAYQVNFRVPAGAISGPAVLQLTSAWIGGPAVMLTIR